MKIGKCNNITWKRRKMERASSSSSLYLVNHHRRRSLQVNTHLSAFIETYKMCAFFCTAPIFAIEQTFVNLFVDVLVYISQNGISVSFLIQFAVFRTYFDENSRNSKRSFQFHINIPNQIIKRNLKKSY